jgi:predicted nicotinamide N-methyase
VIGERSLEHTLCHLDTLALRSSHPAVRRLKKGYQPSIHGNKVWRSSFVLMSYLDEHPVPAGSRVFDVGCGWGLTGIYLARCQGARVTGIDADPEVQPYLEAQAQINGVGIDFRRSKFEQITLAQLRGVQCLVGADICFWDELVRPLHQLIGRAADAGVNRVLIADPGREPFWELSERCRRSHPTRVETLAIEEPYRTSKQILVVSPG